MPPTDETRALLIKKLLNKAEAKGTTSAERDALNGKATTLMLKWGIEEALIADVDRVKIENVVRREFVSDAPKSYSYEMTCIGVEVARAMNCRGFLQKQRDGRTNVLVVGFESDVERVAQLFTSLALQCTFALTAWYKNWVDVTWSMPTGTEKYNAKRAFIIQYARGVRDKLTVWKTVATQESGPGTSLALVNRVKKVDDYVATEMKIRTSPRRTYNANESGYHAGQRADIGGSKIGGNRHGITG